MVGGEVTLTHPTAHAASRSRDDYAAATRPYFWAGVGARRRLGLRAADRARRGAVRLVGLLAHEHAYVQAGQSVPLA